MNPFCAQENETHPNCPTQLAHTADLFLCTVFPITVCFQASFLLSQDTFDMQHC